MHARTTPIDAAIRFYKGGGGAKPPPPPKPPAPSKAAANVSAMFQQRRIREAQGFQSTLLTGGQNQNGPVAMKTLLGE